MRCEKPEGKACRLCFLISLGTHPTLGKQHKLALLPPFWLQYTAGSKAMCSWQLRDSPNTVITQWLQSGHYRTPQHNHLFSTHINIQNILGTGRQTKKFKECLTFCKQYKSLKDMPRHRAVILCIKESNHWHQRSWILSQFMLNM